MGKKKKNLGVIAGFICCGSLLLSGCGNDKNNNEEASSVQETSSAEVQEETKATSPELDVKNLPAPKKGADNPYLKYKDFVPGSREYDYWYVMEYATSAFAEERQKIDEIITGNKETIPLTFDDNGCWVRSNNKLASFAYKGEMDGSVPDGWGVIYQVDGKKLKICCAGKFEKGFINGYAQIYADEKAPYKYYTAGKYKGDYYAPNLIKEGICKQEGSKFKLKGFTIGYDILGDDTHPDSGMYCVYIGKLQAGHWVGDAKWFTKGYLAYEGELDSDNLPNGKGIVYYENGKIRYKGELKAGKFDGKGTLYKKNGDVDYDGNWKNNDYAR